MTPEIIYEVQSGPFWDWRVALDLFLGGAGDGAFLVAPEPTGTSDDTAIYSTLSIGAQSLDGG